MKQEYFINFDGNSWTNDELARITNVPSLIYGSCPTWELHLVQSNGDGGSVGVDLSQAVAWSAAVDTDFTQSTTPMVRTLDSGIDHSQAVSGIIAVELETMTETFFAKVDGKQSVPAFFELRGLDANDKVIYCWQLRINALGAVDAEGGEPIPVASGGVTLSDVYAIVRQTPLLQYSENGTSWHDTQSLSDLYARVSVSGGEWSDEILLPSGTQGPEGPQGPKGEDGSVIEDVTMTVLPSDAQGYATFDDGTLSFGIPSGAEGPQGPQGPKGEDGDVITDVTMTVLPSNAQGYATFEDGVLDFGIPSGMQGIQGPQGETGPQGPKGEDGDAITSVTVTTLPDTAQASASFTDGVLSFGIPSGTPGENGNPDAVTAVDELPSASLATVGKAYMLKTTGHTYVGASQIVTREIDTPYEVSGFLVTDMTQGRFPETFLSAATPFISGGTYTGADGNTHTYYVGETADSSHKQMYLADYYYNAQIYTGLVAVISEIHPSGWNDAGLFQGDSWWAVQPTTGGRSLENSANLRNWYYRDDNEYGQYRIDLVRNIPADIKQVVSLSGFTDDTYNGDYTYTGSDKTYTDIQGNEWIVKIYSNINGRITYLINNPFDGSTLSWALGPTLTNVGYFSQKTINDENRETFCRDMLKELVGVWYRNSYETSTVNGSAQYFSVEYVQETEYYFEDVTPESGSSSGYGRFIRMNGGQTTMMVPNSFCRYEGSNSTLTAWIAPPSNLPWDQAWTAQLSFNGNVGLSGSSYVIFDISGNVEASVAPGNTYILQRNGIYQFLWQTAREEVLNNVHAEIRPFGYFQY